MSNETETSGTFRFISAETFEHVVLAVVLVGTSVFSMISLITNCITLIVFRRQGLKEHVNFTFFCLALTDAALALVTLSYIFSAPGRLFPWNGILAHVVFSWTRVLLSDISIALTVFISVERSLCVIFPFTFNLNFDMKKTKLIICVTFSIIIINYVPLYSSLCVESVTNANNETSVQMCITDTFIFMARYIAVTFEVILASVCQVCTFICVVVMHTAMSRSSKIRKGDHDSAGLSRREKRVVRMVVAIAVLYMLTNLPKVLVSIAGATVQDLVFVYVALFNTISNIGYLMSSMTGSFHIIIFYKFNSSYRRTLISILTLGRTSIVDKNC